MVVEGNRKMFLNEVQECYMQYLGNVLIHIAYYGRKIKKMNGS